MGASKTLFAKFTEDEYMQMPERLRGQLNSKIYSESSNDHSENMQDELYADLYNMKKKLGKQLDERQYQLREERRLINK